MKTIHIHICLILPIGQYRRYKGWGVTKEKYCFNGATEKKMFGKHWSSFLFRLNSSRWLFVSVIQYVCEMFSRMFSLFKSFRATFIFVYREGTCVASNILRAEERKRLSGFLLWEVGNLDAVWHNERGRGGEDKSYVLI